MEFRNIEAVDLNSLNKFHKEFKLDSLNENSELNQDKIFDFIKRNLILSVMFGGIVEEEAKAIYQIFLREDLNGKIWTNIGTVEERKKMGTILDNTSEDYRSAQKEKFGLLLVKANLESLNSYELGDLPLFSALYIDPVVYENVVPRVPLSLCNKVEGCIEACDRKAIGFGGATPCGDGIEMNLALIKANRCRGASQEIVKEGNIFKEMTQKCFENKIPLYSDCKLENIASFKATCNAGFIPISVGNWEVDPTIQVIHFEVNEELVLNPINKNKAIHQRKIKNFIDLNIKSYPILSSYLDENSVRK